MSVNALFINKGSLIVLPEQTIIVLLLCRFGDVRITVSKVNFSSNNHDGIQILILIGTHEATGYRTGRSVKLSERTTC